MAWVLCVDGCGLHHRPGDPAPLHDAAWLARERDRLLGEVVNARVATLVALAEGIDDRARELRTRYDAAVERGLRQGIIDDLESRWCETFETRALVAALASPPTNETGIVGRHWIRPNADVEDFHRDKRKMSDVGLTIDARRYFEARGYPMLDALPDELAAARERRDGAPVTIETRASASGITLDVDLGKPPTPRKT